MNVVINSSDNESGLAELPYYWTSSSTGYVGSNSKAGSSGISYTAWIKDKAGIIASCSAKTSCAAYNSCPNSTCGCSAYYSCSHSSCGCKQLKV